MANSSSMQDVCSICTSHMNASFEYPFVGPFDVFNEQMNATQGFPPTNNTYSNTYNHGWKNHHNFSWRSQNVENPQTQCSRPTPPDFRAKCMPIHHLLHQSTPIYVIAQA